MNLRQYYGSLRKSMAVKPKRLISMSDCHLTKGNDLLARKVSFIIPTRDRVDLLRPCVESLVKVARGFDFEIIIIDNRSKQAESLNFLEDISSSLPTRIFRYDKIFNYAEMMNLAANQATSDVLVFVNNDIVFLDPNYLRSVLQHLQEERVGVVGCVLKNTDQTIQSYGVALGYNGVAGHLFEGLGLADLPKQLTDAACIEVSGVSFALAAVSKSHFNSLGGLDTNYRVGLNDIDFCLKSQKAGFKNVVCTKTHAQHVGSASRGSSFKPKRIFRASIEVLRFMRHHKGLVDESFEIVVGK